jgi:hypothetical protein
VRLIEKWVAHHVTGYDESTRMDHLVDVAGQITSTIIGELVHVWCTQREQEDPSSVLTGARASAKDSWTVTSAEMACGEGRCRCLIKQAAAG